VTSGTENDLMCCPWPMSSHISPDRQAGKEIDWVVDLVGKIRSIRAEMRVPAGAEFPLYFTEASGSRLEQLSVHEASIKRLAKVSEMTASHGATKDSVKIVVDEVTFYLSFGDVIDLQKEKERLQKEIAKAAQEVGKLERKLGNNDFLLRAPEEVISKQRDRLTDNKSAVKNLQMSLNQLVGG